MDVQPTGGKLVSSEVDQMWMMGENDHLEAVGHLVQNRQGRAGAVVVEGDEDVIDGEGERAVLLGVALQGSQPQGEVELVGGAFAELVNTQQFRSSASQHQGSVVFVVEFQAGEPLQSEAGEQVTCSQQDRICCACR